MISCFLILQFFKIQHPICSLIIKTYSKIKGIVKTKKYQFFPRIFRNQQLLSYEGDSIVFTYFQMIDKHRILLAIAFSILTVAKLTHPESYCLGNCAHCDPSALTKCTGQKPCQWGFYDPVANGYCQILPSLQLLSSELGQRVYSGTVPYYSGWGADSKVTKCKYMSMGAKKTIDILGLFDGSSMIEKEFKVSQGSQIVEISFSLIRDDWLPINDFMVIQVTSGSQTLQILQISYQQRLHLDQLPFNIACDNHRASLQQYRITLTKKLVNNTFKITFSSFLFSSFWGITNIKVLSGCSAFTALDPVTNTCRKCDSGRYLSEVEDSFGVCLACPALCKTCKNSSACQQCWWGTYTNGQCQIPTGYKQQILKLGHSLSMCGIHQMVMGYKNNSILLPLFNNKHNALYDEVTPLITGYYDPFQTHKLKVPPKIKISINGQTILTFDLPTSQHNYTDKCSLFGSGRMAMVTIRGHSVSINDNKVGISIQLQGITNFGVGQVRLFSIQKSPSSDSDLTIPTNQPIKNDASKNYSQLKNSNPIELSSPSNMLDTLVNKLKFDNSTLTLASTVRYSAALDGTLQFSIRNISKSIKGEIIVQIDKLAPQDYKITSTYFYEDVLLISVKINKSFSFSKVTFKENLVSRILQVGTTTASIGQVQVERYDAMSPQQLSSIQSFSIFFSIFAWIGLIFIIITVITGLALVTQEYIIALQWLYLHLLIGYDFYPISFRQVIEGLRGIGNLDFFQPIVSFKNSWMINTQTRFWLLPDDYNFFLAFLPILITLFAYGIWFITLIILKKWFLPRDIPDEQRSPVHKITDGIVCRVANFIDTIWRYQLISVILLCCKQFINFHYDHHSSSGQLVLALIVFVIYLGWSIFTQFYVRSQYYQNQYSDFLYKFQDRYFCRIPQHSLPSRHHRIGYPITRTIKALLGVFIVTLVNKPLVTLILLIVMNGFQLWYILINSIYSDSRMQKFRAVESVILISIEFIMFILAVAGNSISSSSFIGLGFFLSALGVLIMINAIARLGFSIWLKYIQMKGVHFQEVNLEQKRLQTERNV